MGCTSSSNISSLNQQQITPNGISEEFNNSDQTPDKKNNDEKPNSNFEKLELRKDNFYNVYELKEEIGIGSYAKVHKCILKLNNEIRAVKIIKKIFINENEKERFFEASKILKQIAIFK